MARLSVAGGLSATPSVIVVATQCNYTGKMRFEWDEAKRKVNLKKHGLDFKRIQKVFDGLTVSVEDNRFDYGEERFITFGILDAELVAVAHTENEHLIRVISMRRATRNEEQRYFSKVSGA